MFNASDPHFAVSTDVINALNNSVNGSDGNSTDGELLYYVPTGLVVLLSILYGSISILSVVGNFLVILVIIKNKSMQTVTNFFFANLSVADVMIGIFSIPFQFQAALSQRWDLPHILCPVAPFVKELTVNVSVITLTVISIDRYFAVLHPLKARVSRKVAKIVMSVVWAFSLASAIPVAIVYRVKFTDDKHTNGKKPFCSPTFGTFNDIDLGRVFHLYVAVVQYFLPLVIICYSYFRIMHRIWLTKAPGSAMDTRDQIMNRNKRKVIKMLLIVVALFAFCWLPLQTYNLLSIILEKINKYRYINIIWFCSNWLAMSNSCYNPFIYGLLNEKFKHSFRMLFIKCPCRCARKGLVKNTFCEHSEASEFIRKPTTCPESTRFQLTNGRIQRYVRVNVVDNTESSFV
ncbi:hypothetical protein CAPTEDRAFT_181725 [Capitella teleta]|uniref:G-protein coupled receptors family 1 profile domain-containing protein n=1 Tax=Capitella teleta TaxID=283909 RepID=R7UT88_CAPTE|nr:hypothetical protein CAPTEDRAFT_181725 [Capitella teleta]|eukprot:ELU06581.1 hypothetical protein CAPTEDRAFT_181725 [Capitella teleta]